VFAVDQEPGLSNLLVGDAKMGEAIRPVPGTGLSLLPAGRIPPNPAELLGSKRFEDCVAALKGEFAWVIIDTPPVMAVTDAPIVAHIANGVIFVVGSEMTGCSVAQTAVEQLSDAGARLIGGVLNRVDLDHNGYYYSRYYRREYGHYYVKTA
jgi:capsular exopolysaccharide synthesis family protein